MRIATYNVNDVNKRLPNLLDWLAETRPDAVCLQELKCEDGRFPVTAIREAGYGAVWCGQRTWNGVAILARGVDPVPTRTALPGEDDDTTARYVEAAVGGVLVASLYLPNGNPAPGPKFDVKLSWFERLLAHADDLWRQGLPVVLAGDYNVVPSEADIYPRHSLAANALLRPESRDAYRRLLAQGWTDALRVRNPDAPMFTFWSYERNRWARDAGLRLDHLLLSESCTGRLLDAGVDRAVRGRENASDHAPAWVELGPA